MLLSYRHLRTLYEAARLGTMSAAGKRLGVSPSSISRQIKQLESNLGIAVVEKGVRKITLTEAGEAACRYFREKISDEEAFFSTILALRSANVGQIVIAIGEAFINQLLIETVIEFIHDFPNIKVIVRVSGTPEVIVQVKDDIAHMGLIFDRPRDPRIRSRLTLPQPMKLILSPDSDFTRKSEVHLSDLVNQKMALPEENYRIRQVIHHAESEAGVFLDTVMETNSLALMKGIVASGQGITILPEVFVRDELLEGKLVSIPVDSAVLKETKFTLITRTGRELPVGAYQFFLRLESHLRDIS